MNSSRAPHQLHGPQAMIVQHNWLHTAGFLLVLGSGLAAQTTDRLTKSFERWQRTFVKGKLGREPTEWYKTDPYLHPVLRKQFGRGPGYTRLLETVDLFALLVARGRYEDGQRLVSVLRQEWNKRNSNQALLRRIKRCAIRALEAPAVALGVQAAVFDAVRATVEDPDPGAGRFLRHSDPELAVLLLPVLGSFGAPRYRAVLERQCRSADERVAIAAVEGLRRLKNPSSVRAVARVVQRVEDIDVLRQAVAAALELVALPGGDRHGDFLLDVALDRIVHTDDPRLCEVVVPITTEVRAARSVPILIHELAKARERAMTGHSPTTLPFWTNAVHRALLDLTGFYAPITKPEQWQAFWAAERERFVVAPKKNDKPTGDTRAAFFGVPVVGRSVLFVLDVSGSMNERMYAKGLAAFASARTRLDRAKQELVRAVGGLDEDVEFNVVLFESQVIPWKRTPRKATSKNKRALEKFLSGIDASGGTGLLDALRKSIRGKIFRNHQPGRRSIDEVFLLSDGSPSSSMTGILAALKEWNTGRSAHINTIYIGGKSRPADFPGSEMTPWQFMRTVARENNGQFRCIDG